MHETIVQLGCYWLPAELFVFRPRLQLKCHLLQRITVARPRLLRRVDIPWSSPVTSRRAYEGDVVFSVVRHAATQLRKIQLASTDHAHFLERQSQWMLIWQILQPLTQLLARSFMRYVGSLTDRDPQFMLLPDTEFGVPFLALTHDAVTRLLGADPVLVAPRASRRADADIGWHGRLRRIFDHTRPHQWQRTASFLQDLRGWVEQLRGDGVSEAILQLWREDMGHLMRPFVWILPSHEEAVHSMRTWWLHELQEFDCHHVQWYNDQIVYQHQGRWVPFWTSGQDFPLTSMQQLQERIETHRADHAPEGRVTLFVETAMEDDEAEDTESDAGDDGSDGGVQ